MFASFKVDCLIGLFLLTLCAGLSPRHATAKDDPTTAEVRASAAQFAKAFNAGKPAELVAMFLPKGELIDDEGNMYRGPKEIGDVFAKFFAKFPSAKLTMDVESVRSVGPNIAIEEGTRLVTAGKQAQDKAQLRYLAVRTKVDGKWLYASIREFNDDPPPTPHDNLQPLAWLVGDWVNEGSDAVVKISYRWSDDGSFLLGDFDVTVSGKSARKSSQRIGWDPVFQRVRSWLFDSDGGFGEGQWTEVDDAWIIKSTAVTPEGQTGSATVTMTPKDKDHFTMKGTERIVGDSREDDFEVSIARKPPGAGK